MLHTIMHTNLICDRQIKFCDCKVTSLPAAIKTDLLSLVQVTINRYFWFCDWCHFNEVRQVGKKTALSITMPFKS